MRSGCRCWDHALNLARTSQAYVRANGARPEAGRRPPPRLAYQISWGAASVPTLVTVAVPAAVTVLAWPLPGP